MYTSKTTKECSLPSYIKCAKQMNFSCVGTESYIHILFYKKNKFKYIFIPGMPYYVHNSETLAQQT